MSVSVKPRTILFDLYGTLIDIHTEEHAPEVWGQLARFLRYQGLPASPTSLHDQFFDLLRQARQTSSERHPEFDAVQTMQQLLHSLGYTGPATFSRELTQLWRTLSMRRFGLFPDVLPNLRALRTHFQLGLVSDAQRAFLEPELAEAELPSFFSTVIVSSDYGFRKPDARLFHAALTALDTAPHEAWYVGDNLPRDVGGAYQAGLTAVWIRRNGDTPASFTQRPAFIVRDLTELRSLLLDAEA